MPSLTTWIILTLTISCNLLMISVNAATNDGTNGLTLDDRKNILNKHNEYRAAVSPAATNMRKLKWNYDLEKMAQLWANGCKFAHGNPTCTAKPYSSTGQNLFMTSGSTLDATSPVTSWHNEVNYYTYTTNACQSGKACGHYTQVVWANTQEVGCGIKKCTSGVIFVCNYGAAGNYVGAKPYKTGTGCSECPSDHGACESSKMCTKSDAGYYTIPSTEPATTMKCEGDDSGVDLPQLSVSLVLLISVFNIAGVI